MLLKIKKYIKNNKKQVRIMIIALLVIIVLLVLYKALFYSSSEKAVYGVRLNDIENNEFTTEEKNDVQDKSSNIEGVKEAKIEVKGRLIKFFVTFEDGVSTDDIKTKFNEMVSFINEKVKGYYDVELYAEQKQDGKTKYPVIGYKHKNKTEITFDVL